MLKKQLLEEIRQVSSIKKLNIELMEHLAFFGYWILKYAERNNVIPPGLDKLQELIHTSRKLVEKMDDSYSFPSLPRQNQHGFKHGEDSTEHIISSDLLYDVYNYE